MEGSPRGAVVSVESRWDFLPPTEREGWRLLFPDTATLSDARMSMPASKAKQQMTAQSQHCFVANVTSQQSSVIVEGCAQYMPQILGRYRHSRVAPLASPQRKPYASTIIREPEPCGSCPVSLCRAGRVSLPQQKPERKEQQWRQKHGVRASGMHPALHVQRQVTGQVLEVLPVVPGAVFPSLSPALSGTTIVPGPSPFGYNKVKNKNKEICYLLPFPKQ